MIFAGVLASKLFVGRTFLSAELVRVALTLINFIDPTDNPATEKMKFGLVPSLHWACPDEGFQPNTTPMIFASVLASKLIVGRTFLSAELVRVALATEKNEVWIGACPPLSLPRRGLSTQEFVNR
jgi:hypothetical protein